MEEPVNEEPCCAEPSAETPVAPSTAAGPSETERRFKAFMKAAGQPSALDVTTNQAINIALAVLSKCAPCVKAHVRKARDMGFTQEEIDEAAWMAVSFGGAPAMMFYKSVVHA